MKYDEVWWSMMKFVEVWWSMTKYDEVWWSMMKYPKMGVQAQNRLGFEHLLMKRKSWGNQLTHTVDFTKTFESSSLRALTSFQMSSRLGFVMAFQALPVKHRQTMQLCPDLCLAQVWRCDPHMFQRIPIFAVFSKHLSHNMMMNHWSGVWCLSHRRSDPAKEKKTCRLLEDNVSTPHPKGAPTVFFHMFSVNSVEPFHFFDDFYHTLTSQSSHASLNGWHGPTTTASL